MGRRPLAVIVLAAALYGGYWFLQRFQIEGLDKVSVHPRTAKRLVGVQRRRLCVGTGTRCRLGPASYIQHPSIWPFKIGKI